MPRQRYTLAQLKARLRERAGNNETFWTDPELKDALNEAISVRQALTGEWTTQVTIPAVSDSPSFYPVPKKIVSLIRVGTDSDVSAANPLGGTILVEWPAFESDVTLNFYHSAWDVPIPMRFIPIGGVGPFTIVWDFDDGTTATSGLEYLVHTWELPSGVDQFVPTLRTITATVTDVSGEVFVATFPLTLIDPNPTIWAGQSILDTEYTGTPFTFNYVSVDASWVVLRSRIGTFIEYAGSSDTNYAGNIYGGRYPITVTFDFQPTPGENVTEPSGRAQVEKIELWNDAETVILATYDLVGGGEMRIPHYMTSYDQWNNGLVRVMRGNQAGLTMRQDPDNVVDDPFGPPASGSPGWVHLWMRRAWFDAEGVGNFKVSVTDGTKKTVTKWAEYESSGACGCTASPVYTITQSAAPREYYFDGSASTCAEGSYAWDFGDGSPIDASVAPHHTYAPGLVGTAVNGSFTVDGSGALPFSFTVGDAGPFTAGTPAFECPFSTIVEGVVDCPGSGTCGGYTVEIRKGFAPGTTPAEATAVTDVNGYYIFTNPAVGLQPFDDCTFYVVASPSCFACNVDAFSEDTWIYGHHYIRNFHLDGS